MAAHAPVLRLCPCKVVKNAPFLACGEGRRTTWTSGCAWKERDLAIRRSFRALEPREKVGILAVLAAVRCCLSGDREGVDDPAARCCTSGDREGEDPELGFERGSGNPMTDWTARDREDDEDELREECGVAGVFGSPDSSRLCRLAMHSLQHRGQEGAGIAASDSGQLKAVTGVGLVSDVFDEEKLESLRGSTAIGHVRYATAGGSLPENVQPFLRVCRFGAVAVAHNGNLVNGKELRDRLEEAGSIFKSSSDTEVVLHLMAKSSQQHFLARVVESCEQLEGAYCMLFLTEDQLVAVRDPYGFRPLVMGRDESGAVYFASETCALDMIGATYEREVDPGEVVVVDKDGVSSSYLTAKRERKSCVFELIYFSSSVSRVFGRSVYQARLGFGRILAEESPVECDVVIAVPDSGVAAAIGYASKAGVPFQQGLTRSHYVGRTFIEPTPRLRDLAVRMKLSPVKEVLAGKRVVVVDDSVVRGTTSSKIVRMIREAGASEVHMRIASPPVIASCYYGVDTPNREELISYRLNIEDTRKQIGADSLAFLPLHRLKDHLGDEHSSFCFACFSGDYPVLTTAMVEREARYKSATVVGEHDHESHVPLRLPAYRILAASTS